MFNDIQKVSQSTQSEPYFDEYTSGVMYQEIIFPDGVDDITISNDSSTDDLHWSFDGASLHGKLFAQESKTINVYEKKKIYIRGLVGGDSFRLFVA